MEEGTSRQAMTLVLFILTPAYHTDTHLYTLEINCKLIRLK